MARSEYRRCPPRRPLWAGRPGSDRFRGQPHRQIAAANDGPVIGRPVHNAVLRLVSGMDLRLHPCSVTPAEGSREVRATPPYPQLVFMQQRPDLRRGVALALEPAAMLTASAAAS